MHQVRTADEISTGELLAGRYVLEARIGEGGMARVYRAQDAVLQRTVAIKILRTPVDGLASLERARSETTLLAGLNHHGLVTLYDAHIAAENDAYLVMEYVEGITLRERIAQGPLGSGEASSLTVDLAEALLVAHSAGIVHRDIKPSNVLLWRSPLPGREWRAKLADFGIAHLLDSQRVTTPGLVVGTVAYIAPEQARGATPAPSADIYALGLLLIEALSGTRPYAQAEGIGAVMARLANPPEVPETLSEDWRHLLRWMTAMHPAERPTALEVLDAASRIVTPPPPSPLDEPTAAAVAVPAALPALPAPAADATAVLPESEAASLPTDETPDAGRPRRRGILAAIVLGALLFIAAAFGLLWPVIAPSAVPEPAPSQPVQEQVTDDPAVGPEPAVEDPEPADNEGEGNGGPGNENSGNGNSGNENSGPGNNSGNGSNGGNGNGNVNGNGSKGG